MRLSSRLVGFSSPLLRERERHGWFRRWSTWAQERKDRTPGEKTTRGLLHVQDRSEIAASPPFAVIPSSVSAERVKKFDSRFVWPLFALSHHFVVWYCADADKVYP